jgi:hypothetical protein
MSEPTLHVAFGGSGAGSLRKAIETAGRKDEVIHLNDSLAFGPIDYPDPQTREQWLERELGLTGYGWVTEEARIFWIKLMSDKKPKVLWTTRRSAADYAGFLECVWRLGETPCSVVDLTDAVIMARRREGEPAKPEKALCLWRLHPETILENGLLDKGQPLSGEMRTYYQDLWKRLRAENAPLRVVSAEGIASTPIDYFDDFIRSCAISEWRKSARVIGEALGREMESEYYQTGDMVLFSRLQKLVELGLLEGRGDLSNMQGSEVRLPTAR